MIAFIILSSVISPPLIMWFIYDNIVDQKDQYGQVVQTAEDAKKEVLPQILKHPLAFVYYIWVGILFLIFSGLAVKMLP